MLPGDTQPQTHQFPARPPSEGLGTAGLSVQLTAAPRVAIPASHLVSAPTTSMSLRGHQDQLLLAERDRSSAQPYLPSQQRQDTRLASNGRVTLPSSSRLASDSTAASISTARPALSKLPRIKPTAISAECFAALPSDKQYSIAQHDAAVNLALNLQGKGGPSRVRFICDCVFFASLTEQSRLPCTPAHLVCSMVELLGACGGGAISDHPLGLPSFHPYLLLL